MWRRQRDRGGDRTHDPAETGATRCRALAAVRICGGHCSGGSGGADAERPSTATQGRRSDFGSVGRGSRRTQPRRTRLLHRAVRGSHPASASGCAARHRRRADGLRSGLRLQGADASPHGGCRRCGRWRDVCRRLRGRLQAEPGPRHRGPLHDLGRARGRPRRRRG